MRTVADIEAAITLLRLHNADALRLGELVSLAARIEPELLRAVRLELTPFDAAAEADLWFSPLVETRTADWIVLVPAAARELRTALVTDRSSLTAAHDLITKAHISAPATIILEEEMSWLALTGGPDAAEAIESRLRLVLGKLLEDPRSHKGLAHWFAGAAQRLPEAAQATEAYALLYFVTSGLLDGRHINAPQPTLSSIDSLAGALPASIPKLNVWATLNDYGFTIRPEKVPGFVPLEVPRTDPLLFELRPLYESSRFITLRRGETKTFQIRSRQIELRTAAGDTYRLRRPQQRSTGGLQNLIIGFGGTGAHILTALKELTVLKHGRVPENFKFLLFDMIADWEPGKRRQTLGGSGEEATATSDEMLSSLDPLTEYFQLTDFDPNFGKHVFDLLSSENNPDESLHLKDWLHAPWFSEYVQSQLNISGVAAQQRQIARYAIFKNAERIVAHLRQILRSLADRTKSRDVSIWLIGSAAGSTGAGCLIDAAYLTRLAAENVHLILNGIAVLPNVYAGVRGIDQGRAYSLLRELDRVQEHGIPVDDRYVDMDTGQLVSSRVVYDRKGQQVAAVRSRLFDALFYLGNYCITEEERVKFFASAASAMEPYLDSNSGPLLLQSMASNNGAASSIGAARILVPTETLKEIFAWEQVAEYLRRAGAPKESNDQVQGLHSGASQDRADSAFYTVRNLLELFNSLLEIERKPPPTWQAFARNELDSRHIVKVWYGLNGGSRTLTEQTVLLTYADPCYSLTEAERPRDSREWEIKTYKENVAAGGVKETQEESRLRFADRLDEIRWRYTSSNGGERTFEKGRRYVLETVSELLQKKIDNIFSETLSRRWQFAQAKDAPEQGTTLTQLFAEVNWMLRGRGPVRKTYETVGDLLAVVANEQVERELRLTRALEELRDRRKSGWLRFGVWVEQDQQAARDECTAYFRWYQKRELLADMLQVITNVEQRLREWERLLSQLFNELVITKSRSMESASALFIVTQIHLKGTVQQRLDRAARSADTLISFGSQPDPQMHGYQEVLRKQSANGLAAGLLNRSSWETEISADGRPTITLVIDSPELKQQRYSVGDIRLLPNELYQFFHAQIDQRLYETDVFDYLLWLQEHRDIHPVTILKLLNARATALIHATRATEISTLIYRDPPSKIKKEVVDKLAFDLEPALRIERYYSDRNSIMLLKMKKPAMDQIDDIDNSRREYLSSRTDALNNNEAHDQKLRRALVFHPFRQELEAWYIERYYIKNVKPDVPVLPPRIVRLLEDPEMMQLFVHGIATLAIEKTGNDWVWHGADADLRLTDYESHGDVDVIQAAINFVLRQGEAKRHSTRRIFRKDAFDSVFLHAQRRGMTLDLILEDFVNRTLVYLLADNATPELRLPLHMVFTFYCDPKTRTSLQFRMDL